MSTQFRVVLIGLLFAATFTTGFWMWNTSKPVPGLKLNLHKFLSLAALILSALLVNDLRRQSGLSGQEAGAVVTAGVAFFVTILSGGLVSINRALPRAVKLVHRVGPFLTVIAEAAAFYLLIARV